MDLPVNRFKRAIVSAKTPLGAWLMSGTPSTAEALGCVGFDFLVVDTEHTPIDTPQMIDILRAIAGTPASGGRAAAVERHGDDQALLDAGAQTLLFPFVQNAGRSARAVASTRYPPARRARRRRHAPRQPLRHGPQLPASAPTTRSASSCRSRRPRRSTQLEAIAAVPGVDSIFIGPADLSASMGHLGDMGNAAVQEKLKRAARSCASASASRAASSAPTPRWRDASSNTASPGSRSAPTCVRW